MADRSAANRRDDAPVGVAEWLLDEVRALQSDPGYLTEELLLAINEAICQAMSELKISRSELARRLNWRRSAVSKMLNGNQNISVRRLVEVAAALGLRWSEPELIPLRKSEQFMPASEAITIDYMEYEAGEFEFSLPVSPAEPIEVKSDPAGNERNTVIKASDLEAFERSAVNDFSYAPVS